MTFVLSPQLDSGANPNLHWELYKSYLENNRKDIPESVFETISHPNWEGGSNSYSPYMSDVKSFALTNIGTTESHCRLVLTKGDYLQQPIEIEIEYSGLLDIDLPNSGGLRDGFVKTWRYHQFLVCDAWARYEVEGKYFTHQIEFVGGLVWSISASRIQAYWRVT
jgi:hypothetical protein